MCNLLASERRERERRLSCCGRRHRRSRTDGRTDGETGEIPATNAFPLSAHLQVLHATIPRSSLSSPQCCPKLVNRCKLGRRAKEGLSNGGRREGSRREGRWGRGGGGGGHGMCGRRRGEGEEGGKLRRSRSIGQGRRGSLNGVQWRGDDTSAS